jgi:phosphatidylglycerophosphatase C
MLSRMEAGGDSSLVALSSDDVIALLEAHDVVAPIIAFDADGTLWSGDIGVDTFEALLSEGLLRQDVARALTAEANLHGVTQHADPNDQARALYDSFRAGAYPEERAFVTMAWAFAGMTRADMRAITSRVIETVGLRSRVHAEVLPVLAWANEREVPVYVVSASPAIVVVTAVASLGLSVAGVFAMPTALGGEVFLPRLAGVVTYGGGKVEALRQGVPNTTLLGAFGDSAFDLPMLTAAHVAVAVRPKPELSARAASCPGLVLLAKGKA